MGWERLAAWTWTPRRSRPRSWSIAGNDAALYYLQNGSLWLYDLSGDAKPQRLGGDLPLGSTQLSLSPDGRWLAYTSDTSGRDEVSIKPFPTGSESWQISRGGAVASYWSSRGDELFYIRQSGDERWMCSARIVATRRQIAAGPPTELFKVPADAVVFGPHPDGERFILVRRLPATFKGDRVEAIINWSDAVEARVSGR